LESREGLRIFNVLNKARRRKIKVMFKAIRMSEEDYMGFTWYAILKDGVHTGKQFNAWTRESAIAMYKQFYK
jgi:hypothetical protein